MASNRTSSSASKPDYLARGVAFIALAGFHARGVREADAYFALFWIIMALVYLFLWVKQWYTNDTSPT